MSYKRRTENRNDSNKMNGWMVLLVALTLALANNEKGGEEELPAHKRQSVQYSTLVGPSFVNASLHVKAHASVGKTAYLTCIVKNLHNYTISWIRVRDIHLLTAGHTTYTSDNRFTAVNPGGGDQWMLRLHHVRLSDAGIYLCQVSVSPPISTAVLLRVTEATVKLRPGNDVYLKAGSRVVLVCEVSGCPYPASPSWYKENQLQEGTDVMEGRIQATLPDHMQDPSSTISPLAYSTVPNDQRNTALQQTLQKTSENLVSDFRVTPLTSKHHSSVPSRSLIGLPIATVTLRRPKASSAHSGVYTCTNTCTDPVNLTLHVLTGDEETAAMQHPNAAEGLLSPSLDTKRVLCQSLVFSVLTAIQNSLS